MHVDFSKEPGERGCPRSPGPVPSWNRGSSSRWRDGRPASPRQSYASTLSATAVEYVVLPPGAVLKIRALLETAQFAQARWTIAWCEHARPHPQRVEKQTTYEPSRRRATKRRAKRWIPLPPLFQGQHWYVRPNRGRPSAACFLAQAAAKKARARTQLRAHLTMTTTRTRNRR